MSEQNSTKANNPIDLSKLSKEEQIIYQKYGKIPKKKDLVSHKLKERKYFDSGDYALYKAGVGQASQIGNQHPSPESIPHSAPTAAGTHAPNQPHHLVSIKPKDKEDK